MENSNGPKRTRSESSEDDFRTTTTVSSQTSQPAPDEDTTLRDPELEEEMERLGVDEDLKASLRCMSPEERAEVLNDIIRSQQREPIVMPELEGRLLSGGGAPFSLLFEDAGVRLAIDEDAAMTGEDMSRLRTLLFARRRAPNNETPDVSGNDRTVFSALLGLSRRLQLLPIEVTGDHLNVIHEIIQQQLMGLPHDVDEMSYEQLLELQERIGVVSKGITQEQIHQCMNDVSRPKEGSCVVCQNEWQESDEKDRSVELKVCRHVFHGPCIEQWLRSNKTCPVCKREVV